jgi:hypothetical protein
MTVGLPPLANMEQGLVDATWLNGLAAGQNQTFQSGLAAPNAANQGTATPVPSGISMVEVDSSVNTGSLVLPFAVAGTEISIIQNGTGVLNIYANAGTNPLTAAQDQINNASNATAFATVTSPSVTWFACAKNGKWYAK